MSAASPSALGEGVELDPDFSGHFEALREGSIAFPYCARCERYHWYPMGRCPFCHGAWYWKPASGPCRLLSWTRVYRHFSAREDLVLPYLVALVVFDDAPGVRLVSALMEVPPDPRPMASLEPIIDAPQGGRPRLTFRL